MNVDLIQIRERVGFTSSLFDPKFVGQCGTVGNVVFHLNASKNVFVRRLNVARDLLMVAHISAHLSTDTLGQTLMIHG